MLQQKSVGSGVQSVNAWRHTVQVLAGHVLHSVCCISKTTWKSKNHVVLEKDLHSVFSISGIPGTLAMCGGPVQVLAGHVLDSVFTISGIPGTQTLRDLTGAPVTFSLDGATGAAAVQAPGGGAVAAVVTRNIPACGAVIHVIDTVLQRGEGGASPPPAADGALLSVL